VLGIVTQFLPTLPMPAQPIKIKWRSIRTPRRTLLFSSQRRRSTRSWSPFR